MRAGCSSRGSVTEGHVACSPARLPWQHFAPWLRLRVVKALQRQAQISTQTAYCDARVCMLAGREAASGPGSVEQPAGPAAPGLAAPSLTLAHLPGGAWPAFYGLKESGRAEGLAPRPQPASRLCAPAVSSKFWSDTPARHSARLLESEQRCHAPANGRASLDSLSLRVVG